MAEAADTEAGRSQVDTAVAVVVVGNVDNAVVVVVAAVVDWRSSSRVHCLT